MEKVKELVDKCPECLEETNSYGATALYFAIEKPEILKVIVSKSGPSQLVQSNLLKHGTMTPLGRAMKISGLICNFQDDDDGSRSMAKGADVAVEREEFEVMKKLLELLIPQ